MGKLFALCERMYAMYDGLSTSPTAHLNGFLKKNKVVVNELGGEIVVQFLRTMLCGTLRLRGVIDDLLDRGFLTEFKSFGSGGHRKILELVSFLSLDQLAYLEWDIFRDIVESAARTRAPVLAEFIKYLFVDAVHSGMLRNVLSYTWSLEAIDSDVLPIFLRYQPDAIGLYQAFLDGQIAGEAEKNDATMKPSNSISKRDPFEFVTLPIPLKEPMCPIPKTLEPQHRPRPRPQRLPRLHSQSEPSLTPVSKVISETNTPEHDTGDVVNQESKSPGHPTTKHLGLVKRRHLSLASCPVRLNAATIQRASSRIRRQQSLDMERCQDFAITTFDDREFREHAKSLEEEEEKAKLEAVRRRQQNTKLERLRLRYRLQELAQHKKDSARRRQLDHNAIIKEVDGEKRHEEEHKKERAKIIRDRKLLVDEARHLIEERRKTEANHQRANKQENLRRIHEAKEAACQAAKEKARERQARQLVAKSQTATAAFYDPTLPSVYTNDLMSSKSQCQTKFELTQRNWERRMWLEHRRQSIIAERKAKQDMLEKQFRLVKVVQQSQKESIAMTKGEAYGETRHSFTMSQDEATKRNELRAEFIEKRVAERTLEKQRLKSLAKKIRSIKLERERLFQSLNEATERAGQTAAKRKIIQLQDFDR